MNTKSDEFVAWTRRIVERVRAAFRGPPDLIWEDVLDQRTVERARLLPRTYWRGASAQLRKRLAMRRAAKRRDRRGAP